MIQIFIQDVVGIDRPPWRNHGTFHYNCCIYVLHTRHIKTVVRKQYSLSCSLLPFPLAFTLKHAILIKSLANNQGFCPLLSLQQLGRLTLFFLKKSIKGVEIHYVMIWEDLHRRDANGVNKLLSNIHQKLLNFCLHMFASYICKYRK